MACDVRLRPITFRWSLDNPHHADPTPVIDIRPVPALGILVFADYTTLVAYGRTGLAWKTKRLTWSDLKITETTDAFIEGEFWDIR